MIYFIAPIFFAIKQHKRFVNSLYLLLFLLPIAAVSGGVLPATKPALIQTQQQIYNWKSLSSSQQFMGSYWHFPGNKSHYTGDLGNPWPTQLVVMRWDSHSSVQSLLCIRHSKHQMPSLDQKDRNDSIVFTRIKHQPHIDLFRVDFQIAAGSSDILISDGYLIPDCTRRFHDSNNKDTDTTLVMDVYEPPHPMSVNASNDTSILPSHHQPEPVKPISSGSGYDPDLFQDFKKRPPRATVFSDWLILAINSLWKEQNTPDVSSDPVSDGNTNTDVHLLVQHGVRVWTLTINSTEWQLLRDHDALSSPTILLHMIRQLGEVRVNQYQSDDDENLPELLAQIPSPEATLWTNNLGQAPERLSIARWLEGFYHQIILEQIGLEVLSDENADPQSALRTLQQIIHELIQEQHLEKALAEGTDHNHKDHHGFSLPDTPEALQEFLKSRTDALRNQLLSRLLTRIISPSPTLVQAPTGTDTSTVQPQPTNPVTSSVRLSGSYSGAVEGSQSGGQGQQGQPPLPPEEDLKTLNLRDPDFLTTWVNAPIQATPQKAFLQGLILSALQKDQVIYNNFVQLMPAMGLPSSIEEVRSLSAAQLQANGSFSRGIILTLYWIRYKKEAYEKFTLSQYNPGSNEIFQTLEQKGFASLRGLLQHTLPETFLDFLKVMSSPQFNTYKPLLTSEKPIAEVYKIFEQNTQNPASQTQNENLLTLLSLNAPVTGSDDETYTTLSTLPSEIPSGIHSVLEDIPAGQGEASNTEVLMSVELSEQDFMKKAKLFFERWRTTSGATAKISDNNLVLLRSAAGQSNTPEDILKWIASKYNLKWDELENWLGLSDVIHTPEFSVQNDKVKTLVQQMVMGESAWLKLLTDTLREIFPDGIRTQQAVSIQFGLASWRWIYDQKEETFRKVEKIQIVVHKELYPATDELNSLWFSIDNVYKFSAMVIGLLKDWRINRPSHSASITKIIQYAEQLGGIWFSTQHKESPVVVVPGFEIINTLRYHKFHVAPFIKSFIHTLYIPASRSMEQVVAGYNLSALDPKNLERAIEHDLESTPQWIPSEHLKSIGEYWVNRTIDSNLVMALLNKNSQAVKYIRRYYKRQISIPELHAVLHFFQHPEIDYKKILVDELSIRGIQAYLSHHHQAIMAEYFPYWQRVLSDLESLSHYPLELQDFIIRLPKKRAVELWSAQSQQELMHYLVSENPAEYTALIQKIRLDYQYFSPETPDNFVTGSCPQCRGQSNTLQPVSYSQLAPRYYMSDEQKSCGICDQCGENLFLIHYKGTNYVQSPTIAHCQQHSVDLCQDCLKGETPCPLCKNPLEPIYAPDSGYGVIMPEGYSIACDQCRATISSVNQEGQVIDGKPIFNRCTGEKKHDTCHSCSLASRYTLPVEKGRVYAFNHDPERKCRSCDSPLHLNSPTAYKLFYAGAYSYHTECANSDSH